MLFITNTVTGKKEEFVPLRSDMVTMYVCGITPYAPSHLGHGRCYVSFDVLYRLLTFLGYHVRYCRNFTDIDDKLLQKAEEEFGDVTRFGSIADRYIAQFHKEVALLNCLTPDYEPRVTKNMHQIIAFIDGLIRKGHAYAADGNVYFDVKSFASYGKLSKHKLKDLRSGQRVMVREDKRDPLDFVLWKADKKGQFWNSPWGNGRPGWHIECSALAKHYLGEQIDIHAGGIDLMFPHHENEIAQSEALNDVTFARYWMHNGMVNIKEEKMSKSLSNAYSLDALCTKIDPMVIRFYLLNHHYRMPIDFSLEDVKGTKKAFDRLYAIFSVVKPVALDSVRARQIPVINRMLAFLLDDLNIPGMIGVLFENIDEIKNDTEIVGYTKQLMTAVLGIDFHKGYKKKDTVISPEVQNLINERNHARHQKDWKKADEIRDRLIEMGVEVQDSKID